MKYLKKFNENIDDYREEFLDEIKDLIPDTFSLSKGNFFKFNYTTKKYTNPYNYISFNIEDIKEDDYDIIISDLYRLYGILNNDYKISFSIEINHPYEDHNDINFKKCIDIINRVKNNYNIWSPRNSISNLCIIFEF